MSLVSFVKVEKEAEIKKGILDALDLIQYKLPTNIKSVVIKPNMCYYWDYTTGQTTDPKFVAALIDLIREKISPDTDISIVESDASAMKCKYAFKMLGYEKLSQNYDVKLVNLSQDKCDDVEVTVGNQSFHLMVPWTIRDADLKINIPKIKYTLEKIKLTCALKNIFGCNPYPKKFKYHSKIEEAIVALNKVMKFDLCIIDGNIISGAKPRKIGLVMASKDPVAIDAAAAKIAGINPKTIRYFQLAAKEGIGHTDFIQKGVPLDYFKERYSQKDIQKKLMGKAYELIVTMGLSKRLGLA
jgi:uncharacterized protein (DUF362 family)